MKPKKDKDNEFYLPPNNYLGHIPCELTVKISKNTDLEQQSLENYLIDEYDMEAVDRLFKPNTIALCDAGCGKTFAAIHYAKSKFAESEILGVCAWNSQAKNLLTTYKIESITYHNLRGEGVTGKKNKTAYKVEDKKCMIFDEFLLFTHSQLCKIRKYMEDHPEIVFLATGDPYQLEAIGDILSNKRKIRYVRKMFPHIVVLRTNKRILESDRPMLKAIKADIESNQMTVEAIVKKYFANRIIDSLDDLKPNKIFRGVSFFDSSARSINKTIHEYFPHNQKMVKKVKTLENEITHYFHSQLICKRSMRLVGAKASKHTKGTKATKGVPIKGKLCPNYVYKVLKMTNKKFTIMDVLDKT